jgi:hypothetical protein
MNRTYNMSNQSKGPIVYKSEAARLQEEADTFTKKFEHEKK